MQICMDILIKMRENIFVAYFLILCPSDFNYAIVRGVRGKKEKNTVRICIFHTE